MESYPPKVHFSEEHILAPRGCCAPKFLHVLENDQVLLANPPPVMGAPLTTFLKEGSKIGLKCNKGAHNFGVRGCSQTKHWHLTWFWVGVLKHVQILGEPPSLKFGRAKNVQKSVRFTTTLG